MSAGTLVSVEEYLNTWYVPDKEYIDGVLVERNVGTLPHSRLQRILVMHFMQCSQSMRIEALPECRTRTRLSRFRVPDVIVVQTPFDTNARYYEGVPLAMIEILSPDDRVATTLARFGECDAMGVPFIIQMDPQARVTHVFESGSLIRRELTAIDKGGTPIPFETDALYRLLD